MNISAFPNASPHHAFIFHVAVQVQLGKRGWLSFSQGRKGILFRRIAWLHSCSHRSLMFLGYVWIPSFGYVLLTAPANLILSICSQHQHRAVLGRWHRARLWACAIPLLTWCTRRSSASIIHGKLTGISLPIYFIV